MNFYKENLKIQNPESEALSKDLFGTPGFCRIPGFCSPQEVEYLLKNYADLSQYHVPEYISLHYRYLYKYGSQSDPVVYDIVKRASNKRVEVCLQKSSDFLLLDYCCRHGVDPNDVEKLSETQLSHSFWRFNRQFDGQGYHPHVDLPGEIQCILFLSKKGRDYKKGGLHIMLESGQDVDADSLCEPGDLVILNSYARKHYVEPVERSSDRDLGRFTLFMPVIPEHIFGEYYYFKGNRLKLFFADYLNAWDRAKFYLKHYMDLLRRKPVGPVDVR